jgi:acyl-CoA thioester hydrolase
VSDEFRHRISVEVRFRDLDAFGHVNNAVITSYAEHGRIRYLRDVLEIEPVGLLPLILAMIKVDYVAPVFFGQRVDVASRVDWIGTRSLSMSHQLRASAGEDDAHDVARATSVLVAYDYESSRSIDVPARWRAALARYEGRELTRVAVEA